jgi:hypothetical protein
MNEPKEKTFTILSSKHKLQTFIFQSQKLEDIFDEGAIKKAHWERKKTINK